MRYLFTLLPTILIIGCSTPIPKANNYIVVEKEGKGKLEAEFHGKCALAVAKGDFDVQGSDVVKYKTSDDKIYYFFNEEAKAEFKTRVEDYRAAAETNWENLPQGGRYIGR